MIATGIAIFIAVNIAVQVPVVTKRAGPMVELPNLCAQTIMAGFFARNTFTYKYANFARYFFPYFGIFGNNTW